jgi:succinate-acetate transporter protein
MTQTDRNWWEQMRAKGRGWFIFRQGILHYGTQVGFWLVLFGVLTTPLISGSFPSLLGLVSAWVSLTVCFGFSVGFVLWKQHEKDYQKEVDHVV